MNIYAFELKKRWVSTLIWTVSLGLFVIFYTSFFDVFADESMAELLADFPDAMMKAFGMSEAFSSLIGFFGAVVALVVLIGALFASSLGINVVSVEERDLTADFLLPKPVTRSAILTAKVLAGLTHLVLFTAVSAAASIAGLSIFGGEAEYPLQTVLLVYVGVFMVELVFYAMGLLLSVSLRRMDSPLPFSFGIPVAFYIINSFDTLMEKTFLKYLVPYDYFNPAQIIDSTSLKPYGVIAGGAVILIFVSLTFVLYRRRNIATAM